MYDDGAGNIYIGYEQDGLKYSLGKYSNINLAEGTPEAIGTVDYETGVVAVAKFNPVYSATNETIKIFTNIVDRDVFVNPNTILSIDVNDKNAVSINLIESAFRKPIK